MNTRLSLLLVCSVFLLSCGKTDTDTEKTAGVTIESGDAESQVVTVDVIGEVKDPNHGREIFLSYGAMGGVNGVNANGVASIHVFEDKTSNVGLQLNIETAGEGEFYEAWVLKPGDTGNWKSLGHLYSVVGDVRHALKSDQEADLSTYTGIKVTKEKDDGNTAPGEVVAEGTVKKANR